MYVLEARSYSTVHLAEIRRGIFRGPGDPGIWGSGEVVWTEGDSALNIWLAFCSVCPEVNLR
jgi:hypothetical protein